MERYRNSFCNGNHEDETYFPLSCKIYNEFRKKVLDFVFEKFSNVKLLDKGDLFNWQKVCADMLQNQIQTGGKVTAYGQLFQCVFSNGHAPTLCGVCAVLAGLCGVCGARLRCGGMCNTSKVHYYFLIPGGGLDKRTDRDQRSWAFLNYPKQYFANDKTPKNTS